MKTSYKRFFATLAALIAFLTVTGATVRADEFVGPFPSWKNVKADFKAAGDGKADDTSALQSALSEVQKRRGTLYIPAGIYRITRGLTMTGDFYVSVLGEDPATTKIVWDGPVGGAMLTCNAVSNSRLGRLTFDGAGKASSAVVFAWDGRTPSQSTGNELADLVCKDVAFGLRIGKANLPDGESAILRCTFRRCSQAGISLQSSNALNWWAWNCLFEDCRVGATNVAESEDGGGQYHIYDSIFRHSTEADMEIGHTSCFGIHHNISIGSRAFFIAKRPHSGKGAWKDCDTWGSAVFMQDNYIIDPLEATPLQLAGNGPTFLLDNVFVLRADAQPAPVLRNITPGGPSEVISIGNIYPMANPLEVKERFFTQDDKVKGRVQLNYTTDILPDTPKNIHRKIIETSNGANAAAIQQAINSAVALSGQRPVVHLPAGRYAIDKTLTIPALSDVQLVGDGYSTLLVWTGKDAGPVLQVTGPSKATLRDFEIDCGPAFWGKSSTATPGILFTNCDQPGARIFLEQPQAQNMAQVGYLVDGLAHTEVSLRDARLTDCQVGVRVYGAATPAEAHTTVFGAIAGDDGLAYDLKTGGRLLVCDAGYDGAPATFLHLTDAGTFTLAGGIAPGRPGPVTDPTDPAFYGIDIDDFHGKATFLSSQINTRMIVHGEGCETNVLALGCQFLPKIVNQSPNARVALISSRVPDQGTIDADYIHAMLAQVREDQPTQLSPSPRETTDIRCYRISVRFGGIGFHFSAEK